MAALAPICGAGCLYMVEGTGATQFKANWGARRPQARRGCCLL
jgi:hypothetical protein